MQDTVASNSEGPRAGSEFRVGDGISPDLISTKIDEILQNLLPQPDGVRIFLDIVRKGEDDVFVSLETGQKSSTRLAKTSGTAKMRAAIRGFCDDGPVTAGSIEEMASLKAPPEIFRDAQVEAMLIGVEAIPGGVVRLIFTSSAPREWSEEERAQVSRVAKQVAAAVDSMETDFVRQREAEEFTLLMENAPVCMAMFDRDFRYLACTAFWRAQHGLETQTLRGKRHLEISPCTPESWPGAFRRSLQGEVIETPAERIAPNGKQERWLRWAMHPCRDKEGAVSAVIIRCEDITEVKQAAALQADTEERLRLAVEATNFGLFDVNLDTGAAYWSPEALAIFQIPPEKAPKSVSELLEMLEMRGAEILGQKFGQLSKTEAGDLFEETLRLETTSGTEKWIKMRARITLLDINGQGKTRQARGVLLDITQSPKLRDRLSHSKRLETVGRLAGGIAHDFNNLLTVIVSNMELALRRIEDKETHDLIVNAIEAAELGANFNKRLLSLASHRQFNPEIIKVNHYLASAWQLLSRSVGETIDLRVKHHRDLWPVRADPAELEGALLNLAINARDAMPHGGSLSITAENLTLDASAAERHADARQGDYVCISVIDTGTGMKPEVAREAMEPFFTTKKVGRGTGLGLTSVATFVARADGFMAIDSAPGKGTRIDLYLPRSPVDPDAHTKTGPSDTDLPYGDGEVILVVEDDDMVRESDLQRLEVLGYAVLEARNADEALEILKTDPSIALVFTDIVMPGSMNGFQMASLVQRQFPDIALLLTSGHASTKVLEERDVIQSTVGFLSKPFTLGVLARAVRRALDQKQTHPHEHRR